MQALTSNVKKLRTLREQLAIPFHLKHWSARNSELHLDDRLPNMKTPRTLLPGAISNCCQQSYRVLAHELRNPLATLLFVFELIERTLSQAPSEDRESRLSKLLETGKSQVDLLTHQITTHSPPALESTQDTGDEGSLKSA